jgi:hypothetical protein
MKTFFRILFFGSTYEAYRLMNADLRKQIKSHV